MSKKVIRLALGAMLLAFSFPTEAQQPKKMPRVGFLSFGSASSMAARIEAFRQGLRERGYVEGQNILVEYRYAEGKLDRLREFATELASQKVNVIVTGGPMATRPAKEATGTIPIVMAYDADSVRTGFISSLARPGGNITGLTSIGSELGGKRLELLKEAIPKLSRVAVLWNAANPGSPESLKEVDVAAQSLGLKLQPLEVRSPDDFEGALQAAIRGRVGALMIASDPVTLFHRKRLVELATKSRFQGGHEYGDVSLVTDQMAMPVDFVLGRKGNELRLKKPQQRAISVYGFVG